MIHGMFSLFHMIGNQFLIIFGFNPIIKSKYQINKFNMFYIKPIIKINIKFI